MPRRIVIIGSSNMDMITQTATLPKPGETLLGGVFSTACGGKGANQAVAAGRLSKEKNVAFIACLGTDAFGNEMLAAMQKDNIDTQYIFREKGPSGVAAIFVSTEGENCIGVSPGANSKLDCDKINQAMPMIEKADIILLQHEIPLGTVEYIIQKAADIGKTVILNPAPAFPVKKEILQKISIITPNETEAEEITGIEVKCIESAKFAAQNLLDAGVENVIITMGSKGALFADNKHKIHIAGESANAVDTTAAGDTFNGALAVYIAEGHSITEAINFANKAAAISVTRKGAQPSIPYRREVK
jgi:ribokinase